MRSLVKLHRVQLCALVVLVLSAGADAQEFRKLQRLRTLPPPAAAEVPLEEFMPVSRETVEEAVDRLFSAWNTPELAQILGSSFAYRTRLDETLAATVPRDAHIRVLGIESISTVSQRREPLAPEAQKLLDVEAVQVTSTVAVLVRSQLEYNDPDEGFQRLVGVNEYIMDIQEVVPQ